jgi:hypothetical protein
MTPAKRGTFGGRATTGAARGASARAARSERHAFAWVSHRSLWGKRQQRHLRSLRIPRVPRRAGAGAEHLGCADQLGRERIQQAGALVRHATGPMSDLQIVRRSRHAVRVDVIVPAVSRVVQSAPLAEVPVGRVAEEPVVAQEIAAHVVAAEVVEETGDAEAPQRSAEMGRWRDDAAGRRLHRGRRVAGVRERRQQETPRAASRHGSTRSCQRRRTIIRFPLSEVG